VAVAKKLLLGDREVTRIGLGSNRLTPENVPFLEAAVASGIEHIDTAHVYTGGESEQTIGAADTDGALVATKVGMGDGNGRPEAIRAQVEESLRRLRRDTIELLYLHKPDPETPLEESVGTLAELRREGKIGHVGLSQVVVEQIESARAIVPIAAVQDHYNLAERKHDEEVDYCTANGIVFVPFFPLRDFGGRPVEQIAARHGATPSQVALAWLLRRSPMMLPIPGTRSVEHAKENFAALELELSDDEIAALR
jgi:aryl-alcohol dehydrogenase-like predicted oxidoreductase